MKIVVSRRAIGKALKEATYQREFPEVTRCRKCRVDMLPMMSIDDDMGEISKNRPESVRVWPHDSLAIALYLCPECGNLKALWNQG